MGGRLGLIVPPHDPLTWFPSGAHVVGAVAGDILLVDHGTDVARAIAVGQWFIAHTTQRELRGFTWNDHTAFVIDEGHVSEMGPRGHEIRALDVYDDQLCCLIHIRCTDVQRDAALAFDRSCWAAEYGWWQYVPFIVNGLTATRFAAGYGDDLICSTHVTMVAMAMGLFPDRPPESVMPAHVARWFDAKPPQSG